jgi:asparagine synthase (glutamine-hydrolysing)
MSAQGGVYYRDGQRPRPGLLELIAQSLERQGPDGGDLQQLGPVALAYRACHITPESRNELQPIESRAGLSMTWDGRLDNRDDLMFQLSDSLGQDRTDAGVVLAAFERWRSDCFGQLVGDWAVSIWDGVTHTLYLARDFAGACPLYYSELLPRTLLWSSELEGLAELTASLVGSSLKLDDQWIAGFLALHPDPDLTPFIGIHPVPPGCFVAVRRDSLRVQRYWAPHPDLQIRYRTDAEYEEHFRHLFRQAVRCRLRSKGPVWAHLSGGLDSSSIVCMADHILEREGAETPALETVTAVYDQSPESDERRFALEVEVRRGLTGHHFNETDYPLMSLPFYKHSVGTPEFIDCFAEREQAICTAMESSGARIQLCGQGGDELMGNIGNGIPNLLDLLHECEWRMFWKDLGRWSVAVKTARVRLGWETLTALLPQKLQALLDHPRTLEQRLRYIDQDFCARFGLRALANPAVQDPYDLSLPSARGRASGLNASIHTVCRTPFRRMGLTHVTYPYMHRPLVTFLLSIPMDQQARPGERRSLMRRSLRYLLPDLVLRRRAKQSPDSALYRALIYQWPAILPLLTNPLSSHLGYICLTKLEKASRDARHGTFPVSLLAKVVCLEAWLQRHGSLIGVAPTGDQVAERIVDDFRAASVEG